MISKIANINGTQFLIRDDDSREFLPDLFGKSTDTKPTLGVKNAQVFFEMDTKGAFMFDADTSTWLKVN